MRNCGQCGRQAAEGETFCANCGNYLDWHDASGSRPAVAAPPRPPAPTEAPSAAPPTRAEPVSVPRPTPPPAEERYDIALALSSSEAEVAPGGAVSIEARVRNLGTVVDEIAVRVDGAPGAWAEVEPERVAVYPRAEETVRVTFRPPRDAGVLAGETPFRVAARSVLHAGAASEQVGTVTVGRETGLSAKLVPASQRATRSADFQLVLRNRSNHPVSVDVTPNAQQLDVQPQGSPRRDIPAFDELLVPVRAKGPAQEPDEPRPYSFRLQAVLADRPEDAVTTANADGVFVHEPPPPPPRYVTTLLAWIFGGLIVGVLFAAVGTLMPDGSGVLFSRPEVTVTNADVTVGGLLGFSLGAAAAIWWRLRARGALRAGVTALLAGALTLVWGAVAGVSVLLVLALAVPILSRWIALRRLPWAPEHAPVPQQGRPSPRAPAPIPATPRPDSGAADRPRVVSAPTAPLPPVVTARPAESAGRPAPPPPTAAPDTGQAAPTSRTSDVRERTTQVLGGLFRGRTAVVVALIASVLVVVLALGFFLLGVPGTVVANGLRVRQEPSTASPTIGVLLGGTRVWVRCDPGNGFVRISRPTDGFVAGRFVSTQLPPRRCL